MIEMRGTEILDGLVHPGVCLVRQTTQILAYRLLHERT